MFVGQPTRCKSNLPDHNPKRNVRGRQGGGGTPLCRDLNQIPRKATKKPLFFLLTRLPHRWMRRCCFWMPWAQHRVRARCGLALGLHTCGNVKEVFVDFFCGNQRAQNQLHPLETQSPATFTRFHVCSLKRSVEDHESRLQCADPNTRGECRRKIESP